MFIKAVSPPLSNDVAKLLFIAFDDRKDGILDLRELSAGISACCYGPAVERTKFIFRLFDCDKDGILNKDETDQMLTALLKAQALLETKPNDGGNSPGSVVFLLSDIINIRDNVLETFGDRVKGFTLDQFLQWSLNCSLHQPLLDLLYEVCHVSFGIKPPTRKEEAKIIKNYLDRCDGTEIIPGDLIYLVPISWWNAWCEYVDLIPNTSKIHKSSVGNSHSPIPYRSSKELYDRSVSVPNTSNNRQTMEATEYRPVLRTNRFISSKVVHYIERNGGGKVLPLDTSSLFQSLDGGKIAITPASSRPLRVTMAPFKPGHGFEILPPSVWDAFFAWYGLKPGCFAIVRRVAINPTTDLPEIEYQPVRITFYRVGTPINIAQQSAHQASTAVAVSSGHFGLGAVASSLAKSVFGNGNFGSSNSVNSDSGSSGSKYYEANYGYFSRCDTLADILKNLGGRFNATNENMRLWLFHNGPIASCSRKIIWSPGDETSISIMKVMSIPWDNLNVIQFRIYVEIANSDQSWPEDAFLEANQTSTNGSNSPRLDESQSNHDVAGLIGFQNLGNTCFLNAALQCLSNTPALTRYFLRNIHLYELNPTNPMGFHGLVALRYAELIKMVWNSESPNLNRKRLSPSTIRNLITKTWQQFGDQDQQDAQELMTFLLDGLHEDLNRKRRETLQMNGNSDCEKKEAENKNDVRSAWNNHLKMNDSIIVDLFHGLLSFEIDCPQCHNVIRKYDPFTYLQLPLPTDQKITFEIIVIYMDSCRVPEKIAVRVNPSVPCQDIYTEASLVMFGNDKETAQRFLLAEVFNAMVTRFFYPTEPISQPCTGELVLYELESKATENAMVKSDSSHWHPSAVEGQNCQEDRCKRRFQLYDHLHVPVKWRDRFLFVSHRQLLPITRYILPKLNWRPQNFGRPLLVPIVDGQVNYNKLYDQVWQRAKRFLTVDGQQDPKSAIVPNSSGGNYAKDGDFPSSNGEEDAFPFELVRVLGPQTKQCSVCHWSNFCWGCALPTSSTQTGEAFLDLGGPFLAINWDPRTLYLFFNYQAESFTNINDSVGDCRRKAMSPLSLENCLETFSQQELIDGYTCEKKECPSQKRPVEASSHMAIARLPPVLIVHLKRFYMARDGRWMKSPRQINVPIDSDVDLFNYTITTNSTEAEKCKYRLYAAVCHYGALRSGHYIAYAKHQPTGVWYMFDDCSVKEVQASDIDMSAVYLLFFEQSSINHDALLPSVTESMIPIANAADALEAAERAERQRLEDSRSKRSPTADDSSRCLLQ